MLNPKSISSGPVVDLTGGGASSSSGSSSGSSSSSSSSSRSAKTSMRGGVVPDIVFSVDILLESDEKPQCFRNDTIEPMQTQHRCVEWTVPADGTGVVNLGACIDASAVQAWMMMERNNQLYLLGYLCFINLSS